MLSVEHNDPINERILATSEDKIEGFVREPFKDIAQRSGVDVDVVMARIAAMLRAGTIRRVRQTLLATNLADGALVAWRVGEDKIADSGLRLQALDHRKGAARILAGRTLPVARRQSRCRTFSDYAGKRNLHAWSGACPPKNHRAGKSR
jgi:DNA-binding Lrp family transcriptional regulator